MKMTLLCILIFTNSGLLYGKSKKRTNKGGRWELSKIRKMKNLFIRLNLNLLSNEGYIFQKKIIKKRAGYSIAKYFGAQVTAIRGMPRKTFEKYYSQLLHIFKYEIKRRPASFNCKQRVYLEFFTKKRLETRVWICRAGMELQPLLALNRVLKKLDEYFNPPRRI